MRFKEGKHYAIADTGCWLWLKGMSGNGYGAVVINHKNYGAHRAQYEDYFGPIDEGMYILHSCDTRLCVNPTHLRQGTAANNARDTSERRRLFSNGYPMLSEDDEAFILMFRDKGYSQQKIADLVGVSQKTVCSFLKDR